MSLVYLTQGYPPWVMTFAEFRILLVSEPKDRSTGEWKGGSSTMPGHVGRHLEAELANGMETWFAHAHTQIPIDTTATMLEIRACGIARGGMSLQTGFTLWSLQMVPLDVQCSRQYCIGGAYHSYSWGGTWVSVNSWSAKSKRAEQREYLIHTNFNGPRNMVLHVGKSKEGKERQSL